MSNLRIFFSASGFDYKKILMVFLHFKKSHSLKKVLLMGLKADNLVLYQSLQNLMVFQFFVVLQNPLLPRIFLFTQLLSESDRGHLITHINCITARWGIVMLF